MWLLAGGIAFIAAIVNLVLVFTGKQKYCNILVFVSLSSGLLTLISQYSLINEWAQASDMSALMDVVPTMNIVLIIAVCVLIILNAIAVLINCKKLKK